MSKYIIPIACWTLVATMILVYVIFLPVSYLSKPKKAARQYYLTLSPATAKNMLSQFIDYDELLNLMGPYYQLLSEKPFSDYARIKKYFWRYRTLTCDDQSILKWLVWYPNDPELRTIVGLVCCPGTGEAKVLFIFRNYSEIERMRTSVNFNIPCPEE